MDAIDFYEETSTHKQYIQSMEMVDILPSNNSFQKYVIHGTDIPSNLSKSSTSKE